MSYTWKGKHGPLLIAEIGGNHEGNFDYAVELTKLAIKADVDFIKFQIYSGDTLVSKIESPDRNKHFKKFELTKDQYLFLAKLCKDNNVGFMASVWDPDYLSWIDPHIPIYKIGSGDLTTYPVLKKLALIGKPIILSTGLSTLTEVHDAVKFIQKVDRKYHDPNYLAVLQCTSMYPIPFEDANLGVMDTYKTIFELPVGYSDHTIGSKALFVSVVMGAEILEFHFTDSREGKEFRDHKVSLTCKEVLGLISDIREYQDLKGDSLKQPLLVEGNHVVTFRRAVYPKTNLSKGHIVKEEDLITLRPNHGIDSRDFFKLIGKKLIRNVAEHEKLEWDLFE